MSKTNSGVRVMMHPVSRTRRDRVGAASKVVCVMPTFDTAIPAELLTGMRLARAAIARGELVVIPTDTVYGVAADAFSPAAVLRLLEAKGRERTSPPPVLIPGIPTLDAL